MKTLLRVLLLLLIAYTAANAQWIYVPHGGPAVNFSDAVSEQIYWCGHNTATGTSVTTDGGQTWTSSTFVDPHVAPIYCIDALNADTAYVVTSEIFKTTNRGNTWVKQITTFATGFANCIHFFDANNGVATGDPNGGYFEIYTTTNGGDNWVRVPSSNIPTPLPNEVGVVSSFAAYNNTFWFATSGAGNAQRVIRSTDRGYTWTLLTAFPIPDIVTPTIEFRDSLHGMFITNSSLIFITSDGGTTWASYSLPEYFLGSSAYIPGTVSTYVISAIGAIGVEDRYISLISTDDGATWTKMDSWNLGTFYFPHKQQWTSPNFGWTCSPGYGIYKWPGYTGKHISRVANRITYSTTASGEIGDTSEISFGNFGSSPTSINTFTLSSTNFSLVNAPATPIILQPWSTAELKIAFTPQSRGVFNDSLVILSDAANTSSLSVGLIGKGLEFTPILSNLIYAASDSLYTISLENLKPLPVGKFEGTNKIEGLTISPTDSVLIGIATTASSSTLYRIDPILGGCLPLVTIPIGNIRAIAYSNTGTLFAGSKSGNLYTINTLTGAATLIGSASGKDYQALTFNPQNGKLFASVATTTPKDGIYIVDTLTGTATLLGTTGDSKATPSIAFDADGTLFGLKGTGVLEFTKLISISTINGSGTEIGSLGKRGLQAIIMSDNIIIPVELTSFNAAVIGKDVRLIWSTATELNNYGFEIQRKALTGDFAAIAFVNGQGTTTQKNEYSFEDRNLESGKYSYRLKQLDLDGKFEYSQIVDVEVTSIASYSLEQNYPNPFNPSTTISYGLKEKSKVKLILLNSLGEEIAVLVNEEQDQGYHKVEFNGAKLSSGVYFYKLIANDFVSTKKMMLIK